MSRIESLSTGTATASGSAVASFNAILQGPNAFTNTGDGTKFVITNLDTLQFNVGTGFSLATGIFTVPSTGIYYFALNITAGNTSGGGLGVAYTAGFLQADIVSTTSYSIIGSRCSPGPNRDNPGAWDVYTLEMNFIVALNASDTVTFSLTVSGGGAGIGMQGGSECTIAGSKLA